MENRGQITPEGADFLIAALDPMHDNQLKNVAGWPDLETAASVVRCVKQSAPFQKPTRLPVGNWDAYLVQWPWMVEQPFVACARTNNQIDQTLQETRPTFAVGGLCVYCVASGADVDFAIAPDFVLTLNDTYGLGPSRLLGAGIEVLNTTADIYKQGQVFVWRQPNSKVASSNYNSLISNTTSGLPTTRISYDGQMISSPPHNTKEAMLIPGTRQWRAEDGSYQVVSILGQDNPPVLVSYTQPILLLTAEADSPHGSANNASIPTVYNQSTLAVPNPMTGPGDIIYPPFLIYPIHQTGAIYTGLSPETTLSITWNTYVETFPTIAEPDILVLATPSAVYDPLALQMYSNALLTLPVGVPSDWNGFGDWFADVVATVTDFLTPGALALGMPAIAAVSAGAGKIAHGYMEKKGKAAKAAYLTAPSPQSKLVAHQPKLPPPPPVRPAQGKNKKKNQKPNGRLQKLPPGYTSARW